MTTIKGTPAAVQAVAAMVDKASRLPIASPDYPCECGYHLIEVADYEAETVRCMACGVVVPAPSPSGPNEVGETHERMDDQEKS